MPQAGPACDVGGAELYRVRGREACDLSQVAHQVVLNPKLVRGMSESHGATCAAEG